jgi:glyoxylase-like metal-dependent hydrolase (beta-lactamase superfamily II)
MSSRSRQFALVSALVAVFAVAACSKKEEAPPPVADAPAAAPASAPASAPAAESVAPPKSVDTKAFKIGDLDATALRDGGIELPNDNKVFGVGHTPDEVAKVLSAAGQPTDKLALSIQPLLVKSADRVLLFDTGAGGNFGPGAGHLGASLAAAGIDAQSVTDIFISHVHGDHVGGLVDKEGALAFPNAKVHLSKPEWDYLSGLKADAAKSIGVENHDALVAAIRPKVEAFAPDAELVPGLVKAVEIKGHTPGHSGYLITSRSASLLYVGDSMHHFVVSVQKPDWPCGFDGDGTTAAASRAALIAQLGTSGQRVYAVHFPFPGVGTIGKKGDDFEWVAE